MTTHWRSEVVLGEELVVRSVENVVVVVVVVGGVLVGVAVVSVGATVVAVVAQYWNVAMVRH
jgi:hypothetical protein